jgi:glutamate/tyrosine decarboxylase-like PLP-dependent enzyme
MRSNARDQLRRGDASEQPAAASASDAAAALEAPESLESPESLEALDAAGSLDPDDWEQYRALAHGMLDELLERLRTVAERPVWRPVPQEVKDRLTEAAPRAPRPTAQVWEAARDLIVPYPTGNTHPRFWGWVHGSGTPGGVLADMIAATLDANLGGREHAPVYVERQVLGWFKDVFGFPPTASGVLLTGTSMATIVGLCVARNVKAGADVRARGVAAAPQPLAAYASSEAHVSVRKALELIGLGADALRVVPVGADFAMDVEALRRAVADDRARGRLPFCVVGTAGTVNTGAVDDLARLADVCAAEGLWFHVDGAFGSLVALSPALRSRVAGIERADSIAFDFHKWLHAPYATGCLLVRDGELHRRSFTAHQSYLTAQTRGLFGGAPWFADFGPDLSRGFTALRVWFTVQEHGLDKLGAMIAKNCRQAAYLGRLVSRTPALELKAPVSLNVVCFRYAPPGLDRAALDAVNQEILYELHERGIAAPSSTRLGGELVIRVCITNHRTRRADLDALVESVVALGDKIAGRARGRG